MQEQLISLETAKLAKEAGFDWGTYESYMEDGKLIIAPIKFKNYEIRIDCYCAPTQSLLQKWLREVHNINVVVKNYLDDMGDNEYQILWEGEATAKEKGTDNEYMTYEDNTYYHSYEECLEEQLRYCCGMLVKKLKKKK